MPDERPPLSSYETERPPLSSYEQAPLSGREIATDVAKSAATGALVDFPIGMAGLPGDVGSLLNRGVDWGLGKAADVTGVEALRPTPQPEREGGPMFGSQQIRRGLENLYGGPLGHEPETRYGQFARTIGGFAPMAVTGPGTFIPRMLRQAVVPGVLSEAGGQAAQMVAPEWEPYARAAGALAGGIPGVAKGERAVAGATREQLLKDIEKGTDQFYDVLDRYTRQVPLDPKLTFRMKNQILADFQANDIFPFNSKQAYDALNDLGQVKTVSGVVAWRRATRKELYGKGLSDSARIITQAADDAIDVSMPMTQPASSFLREADQEFARSKLLESLGTRLEKAEGGTAAANSAMNLDNKIRQALQQFKQDKRAWHSLDKTQQLKVDQIIQGKWDVNSLRYGSNFLGGGGGLGAMVMFGVLHSIFGLKTAGASLFLGKAMKHFENALTQRRAEDLIGEIAEKSVFAQGRRMRPPAWWQNPRGYAYGALAPQLTSEGYPYYQGR